MTDTAAVIITLLLFIGFSGMIIGAVMLVRSLRDLQRILLLGEQSKNHELGVYGKPACSGASAKKAESIKHLVKIQNPPMISPWGFILRDK